MAPESLVVLPHGLRLVVSTLREEDQAFRCTVFEANVQAEELLSYRVISNGFEAVTCLEAQTGVKKLCHARVSGYGRLNEKTTVFNLVWSYERLVSLWQG